MEHVSEEGGGKISTEERRLGLLPPTINCPEAKMVRPHKKKSNNFNRQRLEILVFTWFFMALTLAFAWN